MKLFKWLGLSLIGLATAAHVTERSIYETDIVNKHGVGVYYFPTTLPANDTLGIFDDNGESTSLGDSHVDTANNLLGLGITPTSRLHVLAHNSTINPITSLTITPHLEIALDHPTVTTTEIDAPDDAGGISCFINNDSGSGNFIANGSDWQVTLYTSKSLSYSNLSGDFVDASPPSVDCGVDNSDGQPLTLNISWGPATSGSYYLANVTTVGVIYSFGGDLTTLSTILDGTQTTVSVTPWSNIAYFDPTGTAPGDPGGSISPFQNEGESGWTADGTCFQWQLDSYTTIAGNNYVSGNPVSGSTCDNSDGNPYAWDLSGWTDGGNTIGFVLRRSIDGGSTWAYQNLGYTTTYTDSGFGDDGSGSFWGVTYPGDGPIVRNYAAYGTTNTPETYYSATNFPYTATDSQPPLGYIWLHNITYGSTTTTKILGSNSGSGLGNQIVTSASNFVDYNNIWGGSANVLPVHIGHIGDGSRIEFDGYSYKAFPSVFYSSLFANAGYNYPNDSQYYYLTLNWSYPLGVSQAKFLRNVAGAGFNSGYIVGGGSSLNYFSDNPSFSDGTAVTPNQTAGNAIIAAAPTASVTDNATLVVQSTAVSSPAPRIELQDSNSSAYGDFGYDPSNVEVYENDLAGFSMRSGGLKYNLFNGMSTTFNVQNNYGYTFLVQGGSPLPNMLRCNSGTGTCWIGYGSSLQGSGGSLSVNQKSDSQDAIYVYAAATGGGGFPIRVYDPNSSTNVFTVNHIGQVVASKINLGSASSSGFVNIGAGTSSAPAIHFDQGIVQTSSLAGSMEYDGNHYYLTDNTPVRRTVPLFETSGSAGALQMINSNLRLVDTHISDTGTLLTYNLASEFKQNVTIDNAITVQFGGAINSSITRTTVNGSVAGTFKWSMPFQGSSYKKFVGNYQAFHDAGRTVTFPTAFAVTPYCYGDASATAVSTASTTTFTIAVSTAATGNIFCEGE